MDKKDYEFALKCGREGNPKLFNNPVKLREEMLKLEEAADQEEDPMAKSIYIQGRNVLALALYEELMPLPDLDAGEPEKEVAFPERFVAIITTGEVYSRSVQQSISLTCNAPVRYYHEYGQLMKDILTGKIIGVIGLGLSVIVESIRTEAVLRHDLKNMDGWNYQKAEVFPMPPVVDMAQPVLLLKVIETILKMHEGLTRTTKKVEEFILENMLSDLRLKMLATDQTVTVVLVDDRPAEVAGLVQLLKIWPRVKLHEIVGKVTAVPAATLAHDILSVEPSIVLLDEAIDHIKGTDVAASLTQEGFDGVMASITGGRKPEFTSHHFDSKSAVNKSLKTALAFIDFMNRLISKATRS